MAGANIASAAAAEAGTTEAATSAHVETADTRMQPIDAVHQPTPPQHIMVRPMLPPTPLQHMLAANTAVANTTSL
jgi:hypothetical protein